MRLLTYVVARDYGFAPNPFHGYCTLATCKPIIRRVAKPGDWIVGTGSAARKRAGRFVFAMEVSEAMTFDEYWNDPRFRKKKPDLRGSKKQAFGDNIYHRNGRNWLQENSHHSLNDGSPNPANIINDTQTDRVLIASNYIYWGGGGPSIPPEFGDLICSRRGHRTNFDPALAARFVDWLGNQTDRGFQADPLDWARTP